MTADQYAAKQGREARVYAQPEAIDEAEFIYRLSFYPLPVIRQASVRYSPARGRQRSQVIARFVEPLGNPHVYQGDDYRLALGHVEATWRWMEANGL